MVDLETNEQSREVTLDGRSAMRHQLFSKAGSGSLKSLKTVLQPVQIAFRDNLSAKAA